MWIWGLRKKWREKGGHKLLKGDWNASGGNHSNRNKITDLPPGMNHLHFCTLLLKINEFFPNFLNEKRRRRISLSQNSLTWWLRASAVLEYKKKPFSASSKPICRLYPQTGLQRSSACRRTPWEHLSYHRSPAGITLSRTSVHPPSVCDLK